MLNITHGSVIGSTVSETLPFRHHNSKASIVSLSCPRIVHISAPYKNMVNFNVVPSLLNLIRFDKPLSFRILLVDFIAILIRLRISFPHLLIVVNCRSQIYNIVQCYTNIQHYLVLSVCLSTHCQSQCSVFPFLRYKTVAISCSVGASRVESSANLCLRISLLRILQGFRVIRVYFPLMLKIFGDEIHP